jgi:adaptor complexes medium subunit family protein
MMRVGEDGTARGPVYGVAGGYGAVALEDVRFHELVNVAEFDRARTIALKPPSGACGQPTRFFKCHSCGLPWCRGPTTAHSPVCGHDSACCSFAGEFVVMTWRSSGDVKLPFRVFPYVDAQPDAKRIEISLKVGFVSGHVLYLFMPQFTIPLMYPSTCMPYGVHLLQVRGDFPMAHHGNNVTVRFHVPTVTANVRFELPSGSGAGQSAEFDPSACHCT